MCFSELPKDKAYCPVLFAEHTVTSMILIYLNMLKLWLQPQMKKDPPGHLLIHQDGAPPNYHLDVKQFLDEQLPRSWIGHRRLIAWPPRSPDLSPLDFFSFFWGLVNDYIYTPPEPQSLAEL
jgi:hypothetical protein